MLTLDEMAATLVGIAAAEVEMHRAMERVGQLVEDTAKEVIGTYKLGWPELAESTQEDRARKGYAPNEPLLRSGQMRDSIGHTSSPTDATIGSNDVIARYQELGTATIPPRSFLQGSALHEKDAILRIVGEEAMMMLTGPAGMGTRALAK